MSAIYILVKRYLHEGKAPSRNQAYDTYNDPQSAKALRIYRHLYTLKEDLQALRQQKNRGLLRITPPVAEQDRFCVYYERNQVRRTSYLTQEEWDLIGADAEISDFLDCAQEPPASSSEK